MFDKAVSEFGGQRTTAVLGEKISHRNADWVFPERQIVVEHKQIEADLRKGEGFAKRELQLRVNWARTGKANLFGAPIGWDSAAAEEWLQLYKPPVGRIIKSANKQVRMTRERLGWPKGQGVLILSNKSVREIHPLGMCLLVQTILEGAYSEIGGAIYIPNHYLDIPGSDLANILWLPIYPHGGDHTPSKMIEFIDDFGRSFFQTLRSDAPDLEPVREVPHGTPEAQTMLKAKAIVPP